MNWEVRIAKSAENNLRRFPRKDGERIISVLREFAVNPYAGDIEKIEGEINTWRRRISNYRILYEIDIGRKLISIRDIRRRTSSTY